MVLLSLINVFLIISCNSKRNTLVLSLPYNFGQVNFENHLDFDWYFSWIDYSDMVNYDERKIRFAKSQYNPLCETGFIHSNFPDSVYQMTLTSYTDDVYEAFNSEEYNWGYNELFTFEKRFRKIRKLGFTIIDSTYIDWLGYQGYSIIYENNNHSILPAIYREIVIDTEVSHVKLLFECSGNNCSSFLEKVNNTLNSMEFKE